MCIHSDIIEEVKDNIDDEGGVQTMRRVLNATRCTLPSVDFISLVSTSTEKDSQHYI